MKRLAIVFLTCSLLLSCAYAISKEVRAKAVKDVPFRVVRENIEKYKGSIFIFGGFIVKTKSAEDGTWMEIVQNPIDRYGEITDPDESEGRFLVLYKGHLDTLIYEKGRFVTVAGELAGSKEAAIDELKYVYPVFEIKELYLWKDEPVYLAYPLYTYPMYPWWYEPWWRHPYYPWP